MYIGLPPKRSWLKPSLDESMTSAPVKLIVVSNPDIASLIQGQALLEMGEWKEGPLVEDCASHRLNDVRIWWLETGLLWEDDLDKRWTSATGEEVSEIIFPSRHSAASGRPSLTVHPIGIPHLTEDDEIPFGGKAGECPPPNPRLGPWFREIRKRGGDSSLSDEFSLTLETSHHGPWLETPCMFIEIGSTAEHWPRKDAAEILAGIIWDGLGLGGGSGIGEWNPNSGEKVAVGLGGGHYAPFIGRLASYEGVWLGHMLAGYSLPMKKPGSPDWDPLTGELPAGIWTHAIDSAISATRLAFPGAEVWAYMDRKSFKGWQRQAIRRYLESIGIPLGRTRDFVSL